MSNSKQNKGNRKSGRGGDGSGQGGRGDHGNARSGDKSRNNRRRKGPKKKKVNPTVFWGDADQLAEIPDGTANIAANPSAVVQSLGRPPLSGQQNAAELYFAAVYDRAVNLAAALAAAGDLIEPDGLNAEQGD